MGSSNPGPAFLSSHICGDFLMQAPVSTLCWLASCRWAAFKTRPKGQGPMLCILMVLVPLLARFSDFPFSSLVSHSPPCCVSCSE